MKSIEDYRSSDELKSSVVYIRVYFDNMSYKIGYQIPKMYLFDLISSIGGTMGLCLGMSFLSIFEIFDLIYHLLERRIRKTLN